MKKIYKLIHNGEVVYIGQTKRDLEKRKNEGYDGTVPFYKECEIELIEETEDVSRERFWIAYYLSIGAPLLNIKLGNGFDRKKYHREYIKEYREINKDKIKEKVKEYLKEYREINKDKIKEYQKEYQEKNREKRNKYRREYNKRKKETNEYETTNQPSRTF